MKLQGKTTIVTGASSGMGRSIAKLFVQEGAIVCAIARREDRLNDLASETKDMAGKLIPFAGSVTDTAQMEEAFQLLVKEYGQVDILVNNAGILDGMTPLGEMTDELWDKIIATNLTSAMKLTRRALADMLPRKSGVILNIASIGGLFGMRGGSAYTASKSAMVGMTKSVGFTYATSGIRCNAICPGGVSTEIYMGGAEVSEFGSARVNVGVAANPRIGEPEEIATAALFLVSEDASFINGTTLVVDGGWSAY
jgi:NAD(P)-dependent dehydrogenase (short-subunit alcohol dehydrogenase family)